MRAVRLAGIARRIVQIGIVLFFAVMAAQLLDFPQITAFLSEVLGLGGKVIFGAAIIAAGLFIANLLAKLLTGVGATIVKYATVVLFVAMGLKYMGIADSIIELGFGALVVGGAAAAALAFGLGGRTLDAATADDWGIAEMAPDGDVTAALKDAADNLGGKHLWANSEMRRLLHASWETSRTELSQSEAVTLVRALLMRSKD